MEEISVVTGGNSGLGEELVKELIKRSIKVCLLGRDENKTKSIVKEFGNDILYYVGNLEDESFVKYVFSDIAKKGYYADYLYNNAGVGIFGAPTEMNIDKIREVMDSNVVGLMNITYEACRNMAEGGTIINIMSTAALKGNAGESLYCASKWAVRGFTEALKAYYKKSNIHVIGCYPGGMNTPFWKPDCGLQPDVSKFMDPSEVAKVIVNNVIEKNTLYVADITIERK